MIVVNKISIVPKNFQYVQIVIIKLISCMNKSELVIKYDNKIFDFLKLVSKLSKLFMKITGWGNVNSKRVMRIGGGKTFNANLILC